MGGGSAAADGPMDLLSDSMKLSLHTSTYVPNQTTNEIFADATNELATAGGYTNLGTALASKVWATSALVATFGAANVTWTATSVTHRIATLRDDTIATLVKPLLMYIDLGADSTTASQDLVYAWSSGNLFTITVS
jgi:hypothetical protein